FQRIRHAAVVTLLALGSSYPVIARPQQSDAEKSSGKLTQDIKSIADRLSQAKARETHARTALQQSESIVRAARQAGDARAESVAQQAVDQSQHAIAKAKEEQSLLEADLA